MSVGGRFISLIGKVSVFDGYYGETAFNLYGIDVSGFYYRNEIAYKAFNGRWRAGFNFSNIRGQSSMDNTDIEIYVPSNLKAGAGFDFIFDQNNPLGIMTEYKILLDSYAKNEDGEPLIYGVTGSVRALGLEFEYREKLIARTGYSHGINRVTDSFGSLGAGIRTRYAVVDIAFLVGLSEDENPIREKLRISLSLNLKTVFLH